MVVALGIALGAGTVRAADGGAVPPTGHAGAGGATPERRSVKENIKDFGAQATDPSSLKRIKAHEQELEKRINETRDRQRAEHGQFKAHDAVELVKSPAPAEAEAKPGAGAKPKSGEPRKAKPDSAEPKRSKADSVKHAAGAGGAAVPAPTGATPVK